MKIRYTKKKVRTNILFSFLFVIYALYKSVYLTIKSDSIKWIGFILLIIAIIWFIKCILKSTNYYLSIDNGIIKERNFFRKKTALEDISYLRKTDDQYIIKTAKSELVVYSKDVEEKSLKSLDKVLATLDLPAEKYPFAVSQ
ncbi:hypothetical protein [Cellulophaga fucicola]|uniref:Uncharacterized protein n=1 Tax=Cellulophaga fucicola TaxID=76595 RepID=A0A1K1Q970_9FLAO|nr:hypothetical protein [Cellulophaga fucicola]SFW56245.1 hypothetical protein SAMN05660313_02464 [Cellulophaga fucicola]